MFDLIMLILAVFLFVASVFFTLGVASLENK